MTSWLNATPLRPGQGASESASTHSPAPLERGAHFLWSCVYAELIVRA